MVRSAPALKLSLVEPTTAPLMAASFATLSTIEESSSTTFASITFIERPGISQVTSAMPSASTSNLKLVKDIVSSPRVRSMFPIPRAAARPLRTAVLNASHPFDDRCRAHAGPDAQRHQRGRQIAALELVEHGAEDHGAGGTERMPHGDGAAVDVDFFGIEIERLHVAQHHGRERLVDIDEIAVGKCDA